MQFNVAQLLREPVGSLRFFELDEPDIELGGEFPPQPIVGKVKLLRTADGILVRVDSDVVSQQECSRCLTEFTAQFHVRLEEEFFPFMDVLTGAPLGLPPGTDRTAFRISAVHILDIHEPLRQYAAMALPIQPLCREDCAGLCPQCGVDRNTTSCQCEDSSIDARWGSLSALLQLNQERGA
jgi:uncharacterized protein